MVEFNTIQQTTNYNYSSISMTKVAKTNTATAPSQSITTTSINLDIKNTTYISQTSRKDIAKAYQQIKDSVRQQINMMFQNMDVKSGYELADRAKADLEVYFDDNPDAVETISNGEVPIYWQEESTSDRMLDILLAGYHDGMDKTTFIDSSISMVNRAYSEVSNMLGQELPELVLNTQELLIEKLENFFETSE